MRSSAVTFAVTALASLVAAQSCKQQPSSTNPTPNILAIGTPGLNQVVPVGTPFQITWDKTISAGIGSVSIVLLQGPSTNVVPIGCIVDNAPNTGSFSWTPSTTLVPDGNHNYGLQIIAVGSGQFQYSTQFGISNPNLQSASSQIYSPVSTNLAQQTSDGQVQGKTTAGGSVRTSTTTKVGTTYAVSSGSVVKSYHPKPSGYSSYFPPKSANATTYTPPYKSSSAVLPSIVNATTLTTSSGSVPVASASAPIISTAVVAPPISATITPSVSPSTTQSTIATATGAAQKVIAGGMMAGIGAVAALIL